MTRSQAQAVALQHLTPYRERSFEELRSLLAAPESYSGVAADGTKYAGQVKALWDDKPQGNLRIWSEVTFSLWSMFAPVVSAFIKAPGGQIVGE